MPERLLSHKSAVPSRTTASLIMKDLPGSRLAYVDGSLPLFSFSNSSWVSCFNCVVRKSTSDGCRCWTAFQMIREQRRVCLDSYRIVIHGFCI